MQQVKRWGYMLAKYCLDDEVDTKLPGHHFPETSEELESDDDVQSTIVESVDWESDVSASFKAIRINSETTISRNTSSGLTSRLSRLTPSNSSVTDVAESVTNTVATNASQTTLVPTAQGSLGSQTSYASVISIGPGTSSNTSIMQQRGAKAERF